MKNSIVYLLFFVLCISGCKTNKNTFKSENSDVKLKIEFIKSDIPTTTFTGRIIDIKSKEPVVGAYVILRNSLAKEIGTITDLEGFFTIQNLELGEYSLEIKAMEFKTMQAQLKIKEHTKCVVEVQLEPIEMFVEKPVIYLYPSDTQNIQVKLDYAGSLTHTYPKYQDSGWHVTAAPDGKIWDKNGLEYYALFWEGVPNKQIVPKEGFVVEGKKTAVFLEDKLAYLGLNRREANEFIMYWLPRMEDNAYNFIYFAGEEYEAQAKLSIDPQPESVIRVMMLTQPLESKIEVPQQDISILKGSRKGFTVVEWGGSVIETIKEEI